MCINILQCKRRRLGFKASADISSDRTIELIKCKK